MTQDPLIPSAAAAMTLALDLGRASGPTVAVKECLAIAGLPTRSGCAAFEHAPPAEVNADAVQALLDAGCHITGRANMHELAFGMTGANAHTGTPENPGWPDRIPGGSSSGSAALVAAGTVDFAVGTDTGGSIRQPAACCGIYGFKPTFGRISRAGALPVGSSLDCIGPFARSAEMITRAMAALDPTFTPEPCGGAPTLAVVRPDAAPEILAVFDAATTALGLTGTEDLPGLDEAFDAGMIVINAEIATEFGALAASDATLGADVRGRILKARATTATQLAEAEVVRAHFTAATDALLAGCDAIIMPTLPLVPPTWAEAQNPMNILPLTRFVRPFNLSGHPALTIPVLTDSGLPAGLQIVGAKGADARLCAIAEWIAAQLADSGLLAPTAPSEKETA